MKKKLDRTLQALNTKRLPRNAEQFFKNYADLLATGGTVKCVEDILNSKGKKISRLSVVIELKDLNAKSKFNLPVESQVIC